MQLFWNNFCWGKIHTSPIPLSFAWWDYLDWIDFLLFVGTMEVTVPLWKHPAFSPLDFCLATTRSSMQKTSQPPSPSPAPRHGSVAPVAWGENVGDFPLSEKKHHRNAETAQWCGQVAKICSVWNPENLPDILEASNKKGGNLFFSEPFFLIKRWFSGCSRWVF